MRTRTRIACIVAALAGLGAALVLGAGSFLIRPWPVAVGAAPLDLDAEDVTIPSASGGELRGWLVPAAPPGSAPRAALLVLHGFHSSRRRMVPRARFLARAGYAVLLVDLQAQGESPGEHVTFGALEARDAEAGLAFLRRRFPDLPLGAIGVSMGGAALLLARQPLPLHALVVEAVYTTLEQATRDRLRRFLGAPGPWLAPLLLAQMEWRLGFAPDDLRPIDRVATLGCPLLIVHGTADTSTSFSEAQRLLAAARPPKELLAVPGAGHVDLHAFAPEQYEQRLLDFLARQW